MSQVRFCHQLHGSTKFIAMTQSRQNISKVHVILTSKTTCTMITQHMMWNNYLRPHFSSKTPLICNYCLVNGHKESTSTPTSNYVTLLLQFNQDHKTRDNKIHTIFSLSFLTCHPPSVTKPQVTQALWLAALSVSKCGPYPLKGQLRGKLLHSGDQQRSWGSQSR